MAYCVFKNALDQFEIFKTTLKILPLTNIFLTITYIGFAIIFAYYCIFFFNYIYSLNIFIFLEQIYLFIYKLVIENIGIKYIQYFLYVFCLFIFFLLMNLGGMVPYFFTITSHFSVTFNFSSTIVLSATYTGIVLNLVLFLLIFLPSGIPLLIIPFLIIVEFISYIARIFSLAIRLFANIMSGHTLLHILSKFSWILVIFNNISVLFLILPFIFLLGITSLECSIATLQAYVFTILFCIYFNDAINLH